MAKNEDDQCSSCLYDLRLAAEDRVRDLHTKKKAGASREEVINAILMGLPPAGNAVTQALPMAIAVFDGE
jgi:alkylhydroperoxidase/carboxymuconolactone decarboxylase family protein YurZ